MSNKLRLNIQSVSIICCLEIESSNIVHSLKRYIENNYMPNGIYFLAYNGNILSCEDRLSDYNIANNSTIEAIPLLRGGCINDLVYARLSPKLIGKDLYKINIVSDISANRHKSIITDDIVKNGNVIIPTSLPRKKSSNIEYKDRSIVVMNETIPNMEEDKYIAHLPRRRCCSLVPDPKQMKTIIPSQSEFVFSILQGSYTSGIKSTCFKLLYCHENDNYEIIKKLLTRELRILIYDVLISIMMEYCGLIEVASDIDISSYKGDINVVLTPRKILKPGVYRFEMTSPDNIYYFFEVLPSVEYQL